jgi:hypothetical protein
MSFKDLGGEWSCDLCDLTFRGRSMPSDLCRMSLEAHVPGFDFKKSLDLCRNCFGFEYFTDPPSKARIPKTLIQSFLKKLKGTK